MWGTMLIPALLAPLALAEAPAAWQLEDAGRSAPEARVVLVVVTPGVPLSAYLPWVEAIEEAGMDAWTLRFSSRGQGVEDITAGLQEAYSGLTEARGSVAVAAHGYAGVFTLLAALSPARLALVATPLAPHPVPVQVDAEPTLVAERLPWDPSLLGPLPAEPYSGELAAAYARWASELPALPPPTCPTLLVASTLDPVAPPELVRTPSAAWPDRTWARTGPLSMEPTEPTHAELLSDPERARVVARFLAQGGW